MQNRQSGRRRRGGGGSNNPRPMGMASGGQNANRLEVKVRGNAHQLLEKYKQLARDAHQSGDRVATEYYLQHADHYFRVLNDGRIRQEEMRARRGVFDPFEDDSAGNDADDSQAEGGEEQAEGGERQPAQREERGERRQRFENRERNDGGDRAERAERGDRGDRGEGRQKWQDRRGDRPREERADRPREERDERLAPEPAAQPLSDGEAALVAFGGAPVREAPEAAPDLVDLADTTEAPKPRRRGRPRKTPEAEPAEG